MAGQLGQQERKGIEDHIQQIFIILFPNHILLILLGTEIHLSQENLLETLNTWSFWLALKDLIHYPALDKVTFSKKRHFYPALIER